MSGVDDSLRVLTLSLGELANHSDLIGEMYQRRLAGAVVQSVFSSELMAELATRLSAGLEGMPRAEAPTFKGGLYGMPLVLASQELHEYLDAAQRFRSSIAELFGSPDALERKIESVLAAISGQVPVEVARATDGRAYLPASVRVLIEGDSLPIHYENGTTRYASMTQLLPELDATTIMSFYVPVALPASGGVLEVFTTDCSGDGPRIIERLGGNERARPVLAERGYIEIKPAVGDMLVFDGGRHYHHVTEIRQGSRWTMGGFFAFTRSHDRVLYWS